METLSKQNEGKIEQIERKKWKSHHRVSLLISKFNEEMRTSREEKRR